MSRINIDYPTLEEISVQKKKVLDRAFSSTIYRRLSPATVFYQSRLTAFISLLIYLLLLLMCYSMRKYENPGYLVFAVFPITYFCFFLLSLLADEQSNVIELKQSLRFSYTYLVCMRMFYVSLAVIPLNLIMLYTCLSNISSLFTLSAAGTSSMLLLALASLKLYEKTNSSKALLALMITWVIVCMILMKYGTALYHLIIEVVPLAVHIVVTVCSFCALFIHIRKVEKRNAYGF